MAGNTNMQQQQIEELPLEEQKSEEEDWDEIDSLDPRSVVESNRD
jgi:hypothetical protein